MKTQIKHAMHAAVLMAALHTGTAGGEYIEDSPDERLKLSCNPNTMVTSAGHALCLKEIYAQVHDYAGYFSTHFDNKRPITPERINELKEISDQYDDGASFISLKSYHETCGNRLFNDAIQIERFFGLEPQALLKLPIFCTQEAVRLGDVFKQTNIDKEESIRLLDHLNYLEEYYHLNPTIPERLPTLEERKRQESMHPSSV